MHHKIRRPKPLSLLSLLWVLGLLALAACPVSLPPQTDGPTSGSGTEKVAGDSVTTTDGAPQDRPGAPDQPGTPGDQPATPDQPIGSDQPRIPSDQPGAPGDQPATPDQPTGSDRGTTTPDEGKLGDSCKVACDCQQGLDCQQGQCVQPSLPIYCCEKPGCPATEACVTEQGGRSQCPTGPKCNITCDCPQGQICLNGACQQLGTNVFCCDKPGCTEGSTCFDKKGTQKTCSKPGNTQGCQHTCDCSQGLLCIQGTCVNMGANPVYCCDSPGCPSGKTCVRRQGGLGNCSVNQITCNSACDCKAGESCFNGACIPSGNPVRCCSRQGQCPAGQLCQDAKGDFRICGSGNPCRNNCDCPEGEQCFNGSCVGSTQTTTPCCTATKCPTGQLCVKPTNGFGTCP